MATTIQLRHNTSGVIKNGFYGFSWTTFFFGCFPALFRGDFITFIGIFVVLFLLALMTAGVGAFVGMFIWAFFYNGYYTKRLLEKGYELVGAPSEVQNAASSLGVALPAQVEPIATRPPELATVTKSAIPKDKKSLVNDAYKIYLVKKYKIESNDVLKKYILEDALYETVDQALSAAHDKETAEDNATDQKNKRWSKNEAIEYMEFSGYQIKSDGSNHQVTFNKTTTYFRSDEELIDYAKSIKAQY